MKKILSASAIIALFFFAPACSDKKSKDAKSFDSPAAAAQAWCDLNGKVARASNDAEKEAAKAARKKFEDDLEAKYKDDKAFMDNLEKEAEKCEDASEGK